MIQSLDITSVSLFFKGLSGVHISQLMWSDGAVWATGISALDRHPLHLQTLSSSKKRPNCPLNFLHKLYLSFQIQKQFTSLSMVRVCRCWVIFNIVPCFCSESLEKLQYSTNDPQKILWKLYRWQSITFKSSLVAITQHCLSVLCSQFDWALSRHLFIGLASNSADSNSR